MGVVSSLRGKRLRTILRRDGYGDGTVGDFNGMRWKIVAIRSFIRL